MNVLKSSTNPSGWGKSILWLALAVACFHAAYTSVKFPALGLFIFGYAYFLVRLTDQPNVRRAFYFGLTTGFLCAAPQLFFFWKIFGPAAIVLWLIFAFWIGMFAAIVCGSIRRWGKAKAMWLVPIVWTGIEYFRSELYYLKFSWMNLGMCRRVGVDCLECMVSDFLFLEFQQQLLTNIQSLLISKQGLEKS
jgi:apolipoprotein N-acyltransferase